MSRRTRRPPAVTVIARARIVYGLALLAIPNPLLHVVSGQRATTRERAITRVLGARLLVQAAINDVRPDAMSVALGAETDLVHAATMLVWAGVDRQARRLTLMSGALAGLFAAAGAAQAKRTPAAPPPSETGQRLNNLVRLRHHVAVIVARYTLPHPVRAALLP